MNEIDYEELAERLGEVTLIDVRTEAEFSGAGGYPCCGRHGHIPGARHIQVEEILDARGRARARRRAGGRGARRLLP